MNRTIQEQEIATIKKRTIDINLSDADVLKVCEMAGSHGITVQEMIESYLGDLICGTNTNGSDERELASQYFERCQYGNFPENTFLRYLIEHGFIGYYLENIENEKWLIGEIEMSKSIKDPLPYDQEEMAELQKDLEEVQGYLDSYYREYCEYCRSEEPEPLEQAKERISKWQKDYKSLKGEYEE